MQTESDHSGAAMAGDDAKSHQWAARFPLLAEALDAIPACLLLVDRDRRIVLINKKFSQVFQVSTTGLPKKMGGLVSCMRALEAEGGCGTHSACQFCGALTAILESQKSGEGTHEYRLTRLSATGFLESLDFMASAKPFPVDGETLTLVTLTDISSEKRRYALERIFFHDLLNTASGMHGLATMLSELSVQESEVRNIAGLLCFTADQLIEEINAQKILNAAERKDLVVSVCPTEVLPELHSIARAYSAHDVARHRVLKVAEKAENVTVITDCHLLRRVVINLTKNALEATPHGGTVTLDVRQNGDRALVTVHNPVVMSEEVRLQIFNRSFSTRGQDRGLGCYSVKLLTEGYLDGKVGFVSTSETGTLFTVDIPLEWKGKQVS